MPVSSFRGAGFGDQCSHHFNAFREIDPFNLVAFHEVGRAEKAAAIAPDAEKAYNAKLFLMND